MDRAFWLALAIFFGATLLWKPWRTQALSRNSENWWIDLVNLVVHLWGLPLFQTFVLFKILSWIAPEWRGRFEIGLLGSLGLYVLLDYLWYWNHRLLHSYTWVWNLHAVHHSASHVDVFTTARNSIWSHLAEIYMWYIAAAVYLLKDPGWFVAFVILGSISNFWTHTRLGFSRQSRAYAWISKVLITPHEHLWHHSTSHANTNFSTVFSLWDRWHGTHYSPESLPGSYGNEYLKGAFRQLFLPIRSSPVVASVRAPSGP